MQQHLEEQVRDWLSKFSLQHPVVVVPAYNAYEDLVACVESLAAETAPEVPIVILDDASTDERVSAALTSAQPDRMLYVRNPVNLGFVGTANLAFAASAPRDVVLVNSDVLVPPAWLERLQAAAYHRTNIASATPLTNHGSIVSVPVRNYPHDHTNPDYRALDLRVQQNSLRLYPSTPTMVGHCVYLRRTALNLVGGFDPAFSPGYGEEVDWSQRAILLGLVHVVADDLFVYHKGARSFGSRSAVLQARLESHEKLISRRYPWYASWTSQAATERDSPLAYSLEQARDAILGYRVAIDATCIGAPTTGTQQYVLALIRALASHKPKEVKLSVIVSDAVHHQVKDFLGAGVFVDEVLPLSRALQLPTSYYSLIHRPFQPRSMGEFKLLRRIAHRVVITILDFIAFSNVGYFVNYLDWTQYCEAVRTACGLSDGVIYLSADVAADASHLGVAAEPNRSRVIYPGVEHVLSDAQSTEHGANNLASSIPCPYILVLGTDFRHKNRLYALKLLRALLERYQWNGRLVFAGAHVAWGGSDKDESALLKEDARLRERVTDLGAVTEAEKWCLLKNASLVLYPSTREGFGLVPFEAATVGVPTLAAQTPALREAAGEVSLHLKFDLAEDACLVWQLLTDPTVRLQQVDSVLSRMSEFTWRKSAESTWAFYLHVLRIPPNPNRHATCISKEFMQADPATITLPTGRLLIHRAAQRFRHALAVTTAEWTRLFADAVQLLRAWAIARKRR